MTTGDQRLLGHVRYDPARLRVEFVPDPGQMRSGLEYQLVVQPGLLAWDGAELESAALLRFRAGDAVAPPRPVATAPTLAADVAPLLAARCATAGCHAPPRPVLGLDLSTARGIYATAVGVASRERPGDVGAPTDLTDPHWGALARVDPGVGPDAGRPAYSYLLYKLLGDGPTLGTRMPPPSSASVPLTPRELALVADWIARGAPND